MNGAVSSKEQNSTDYQFGLSYGLADQENVSLLATLYQDFNISNDVRVTYSRKF